MPENKNSAVEKSRRGLLKMVFSRTMMITVLLLANFALVFLLIFKLIEGLPILFGSVILFTAVMELIILNSPDHVNIKLTWCVIVAVLPLFGAAMYFFIRYDLGNCVSKRLVEASIRIGQPFVPEQQELLRKIEAEDQNLYNLATYLDRYALAPVYENTAVKYFPLGEDKFAELLVQLEKAEKFIFMEYFLISEGHMWNSILDVLERKAAQGVEVRVLYDGMNAYYNLPYSYPKMLEKKGIRCKMFAPVRPFVSTHYNNRDHRKIVVIDDHTAFTGGVNLEDCYINRVHPYGHWKDTAVMLRGDAVRSFTLMFLQMWNATENKRDFAPYLIPTKHREQAEGYVIPYGDTPTDRENVGEMVYLNMINQAKNYIHIMTPYLILDAEMTTALKFAAKRGVDVQLILPHIPDKKSVFAMAKSHYRELIEAGVKIYEYTPGFVHAKVFLSDDLHGVVGTINLDYRSLYHHFECAAYLYKVPALEDIREDFRQTREKSQLITMEEVKKESAVTRFWGAMLKVFAPLM
jgi:cardiolipin synthase